MYKRQAFLFNHHAECAAQYACGVGKHGVLNLADAFGGIAQWNGNTSKYRYYESICRHAQLYYDSYSRYFGKMCIRDRGEADAESAVSRGTTAGRGIDRRNGGALRR